MPQPLQLSVMRRGICRVILQIVKQLNKYCHYSFGDPEEKKGGERAHITVRSRSAFPANAQPRAFPQFPITESVDRLIRTPAGQTPPPIGTGTVCRTMHIFTVNSAQAWRCFLKRIHGSRSRRPSTRCLTRRARTLFPFTTTTWCAPLFVSDNSCSLRLVPRAGLCDVEGDPLAGRSRPGPAKRVARHARALCCVHAGAAAASHRSRRATRAEFDLDVHPAHNREQEVLFLDRAGTPWPRRCDALGARLGFQQ